MWWFSTSFYFVCFRIHYDFYFRFAVLLNEEFASRFDKSHHILPALNILPSAIVSDSWKQKGSEWLDNVHQSLSDYEESLPSPGSLKTELLSWRLYW